MEERYRLRRIFSLARRCSPFEGDIKMALQTQGTTAPALVISILRAVGKGTTEPGYRNRNGQVVIRPTHLVGTDHYQYVYVLRCENCGQEYGANGSDIFQRNCPNCQGGAPGLSVR